MKHALLALTLLGCAPASAHDITIRFGAPWYMDHHAYGPDIHPNVISIPYEDEAAARQRAIEARRRCEPVHVWTDGGSFVHPASGCL